MTEGKSNQNQEGFKVKIFTIPFDLGQINENISITTNSSTKPSREQIFKQAIKFHSVGNIKDAAKYYQYFIDQGFNDHIVFSNYGVISRDLGKLEEAVLLTRKAIKLVPNYANAHYNLGNILKDLGNLKEAAISTRKAIELKPNFTEAHYNLGVILKDLGKSQEAELSYRKAIKINPDLINAHSNLGVLLKDLGRLEEAELSQRKAIKINPDFAEAHYSLGNILRDLGKLKDAEVSLLKAIDLDPKSANYKLNLGINQFAQGDINSSLETLELAYRLNQNDLTINTLRAILKGRKKKKPKNLRVENIINALFDEQSDWAPIVLHRSVEEELIKNLYSIESQESSRPFGTSNIYGKIKGSDYSLFDKDVPILRYFQKDLIKKLSDYFDSEIYITDSFFNIISPKDGVGGGAKIHGHLNDLDRINQLDIAKQKFSLVYYLSIGDKNGQDQGILKFHNPNKIFVPEEGMIVIFPASRLHSVYYDGKKDRVSLVVNFYLL